MAEKPLNSSYQEIIRLGNMLTDANIQHRIERFEDGWHLEYPDRQGKRVCSVVEFADSFGAKQDRLEIMGLLNAEERRFDKVVGHLTAENVFDLIKRDWERRKMRNRA